MAANRYVYDFDEPSGGGKELLGGKGVGLAEMTALGVPVPAGFTITTDACRAYMTQGKQLPAGLEDEVGRARRAPRGAHGQALRRRVRSAARLGPLGRGGLDAGDDGHDPQPRPERQGGRGTGALDRERPLRVRLVPPPDPDVRRGRGRHRRAPLRAAARRREAREGRAAGHRPRRGRPARPRRRLQGDLPGGDRRRVPAGRARPAHARGARRLRVVGQPARAGLPPRARDPGRHRHRRQRRADGVRQQRDGRRARASASRAIRRRASRVSTASSSRTRRARTSSRASARRSRSRR